MHRYFKYELKENIINMMFFFFFELLIIVIFILGHYNKSLESITNAILILGGYPI